jgi:hypothetical protein
MKFLRLIILLLTAGIIFSSCAKELSAETGSALGTLAKDAVGDCAPIGINGVYKQDTPLNATNFIDVQLDVTQVGIYIISTDTVNGYYFKATGVTPLPGANSIRLVGFGKPLAVGTDVFTVKFGGTTCEFNVNVTLGTGGGGVTTAVFTFPNGTPCAGATQTPNFFVGLPTSATTHTITLLVNVTTAGSYNLSTTLDNGLTFSGTGSLSVGNNQPIVLGASGTPTTAGLIKYTFSTTTPEASSCGFDLTVQAAPTSAVYAFNCSSATFAGTYQVGTAMTSANTITVPVTVTTPGSYNITTTVNGVTFSGSDVLTATSTSITLTATGTPTAAAAPSTIFTLSGSGGSCPITIPFTDGGGATDFIQCNINGSTTLTTFNINTNTTLTPAFGFELLTISGGNSETGNESIIITASDFSAISAGSTYAVTSSFPTATVNYTDPSNTNFDDDATNTSHPSPAFSITISTLTTTRITGTFSGKIPNAAGGTSTVTITNGSFSLGF